MIGLGLHHKLVGARIHELQHAIHGFTECGVGGAAGVVQVQIFLNGQVGQGRCLALVHIIKLPERGFQLFDRGFGTRHARHLAEGLKLLLAFLHQRVGTLGLGGCLLGLALLHIHQRIRQQQPAAQEGDIRTVQLRRLIGIGVIDLFQLPVAGVQAQPCHAVRNEHGAREEQEHQNDTGADFQIDKHEIPER
ncbi:hypothetical protein D3C86_907000 [compost metagenome]